MTGKVYTFILIKVNTFSFIQLKKNLEDKMTSDPIFKKGDKCNKLKKELVLWLF